MEEFALHGGHCVVLGCAPTQQLHAISPQSILAPEVISKEHREEGMLPERLLSFNQKVVRRLTSSAKALVGTGPVKLFKLRLNNVSFVSNPMSVGMVPSKAFSLRSILSSCVNDPSWGGMDPVRKLPRRCKSVSSVKAAIAVGMDPTKPLQQR